MGLFTNLLSKVDHLHQSEQQRSQKNSSLESRQTGSCGGMSSTELKIRIELILGDLDTTLPLIEFARELAGISHTQQSRFLSQLANISDLSHEHACQFLSIAAPAFKELEHEQYERWLNDIERCLIDKKDPTANEIINNYQAYTTDNDVDIHIVSLNIIIDTLDKLIISIHKNQLPILESRNEDIASAYTDGYQFYLPLSISEFDHYEDNYRLYKVLVFHLIGQIHCRTWDALERLQSSTKKYGSDYLALFSKIETLRIDRVIKHEFPGIWRDIETLNSKSLVDYPEQLFNGNDHASVNSSIQLTNALLDQTSDLPDLIYQTGFIPDKMTNPVSSRVSDSPIIMNQNDDLDNIINDINGDAKSNSRIFLRNHQASSKLSTKSLLAENGTTLWQDLPAQNVASQEGDVSITRKRREDNVYYYKEWDTSLQKYRKDWCRVKEIQIEDVPEDTSLEQSEKLKYAEHRIRKTLDLLINDQKAIRYQKDGDEIDIDAWIAARSNINKQTDDYQNLYIRNNKNSRDVAIMFTVDISGSTAGWKNTAIKQSTWLLCKALAKLGDQYAVYAFSGSGRDSCRIYPLKKFSEPYSKSVKQRIFSMQPQQYTRMGASIRHLSKILSQTPAKTKILFVLTDGRPDDIDSYRGHYGIEDTRRAIHEARALALNPFVLTFDKDGLDYLPHMLGSNRYQLISDISELPVQITTIYKQLTT